MIASARPHAHKTGPPVRRAPAICIAVGLISGIFGSPLLADVELEAQVLEISPDAKTERGVISFPVEFAVVVPPGVAIPPNPGLVTTTVRP